MEGNIVWPKNHEKNKESEVIVLVVGNDGRIRGGPVRTLIAKSPTKVCLWLLLFKSLRGHLIKANEKQTL